MALEQLVAAIGQVHAELAAQASRAVNTSLTLRNWLIGCYISEYELRGADRARYGDKIIELLSERLMQAGVSRSEARELRRYRKFYLIYPSIRESLSPELIIKLLPFATTVNFRESLYPESGVAPDELLSRISFSHIAELLRCEDATKRSFYEVESLQGSWTVRELKRQIHSLYYERSGLSRDKQKLSRLAHQQAERQGIQRDRPPIATPAAGPLTIRKGNVSLKTRRCIHLHNILDNAELVSPDIQHHPNSVVLS